MLNIGEKIRIRRTELNMTQKELADKLFVSSKLVSKWERGGEPAVEYIKPLCSALNVDSSYFFEDDSNNKVKQEQKAEKKKFKFSELSKKSKFLAFYLPAICVFIAVICLLSIFVFVPGIRQSIYIMNKNSYISKMNQSIENNLVDFEYYNLKLTTYVDDELSDDSKIWQGYIDENGNPAFKTNYYTVKNGLKYGWDYKSDYEKPDNIKTLQDLLASELDLATEIDFDEKDITYIKKNSWGYSIEFDDEVLYSGLTTAEKKQIKLIDKIRANFIIEDGHFKEMNMLTKYTNKKLEEDFKVEAKLVFITEKPVLEDVQDQVWDVKLPKEDKSTFMKSFLGEDVIQTEAEAEQYASFTYENGYLYGKNNGNLVVLKCGEKELQRYEFYVGAETGFYIYKDHLYNVVYSSDIAGKVNFTLQKRNIQTGDMEESKLPDRFDTTRDKKYKFLSNGNYFTIAYFEDNTSRSNYVCYLFNLDNETLEYTKYFNEFVMFIDSAGNKYYCPLVENRPLVGIARLGDITMTKDGVDYTYQGIRISEENGKIITTTSSEKFIYSDNVLVETISKYKNRVDIKDGAYAYVGSNEINYPDGTKDVLQPVIVGLTCESEYLKFVGSFNGKVVVECISWNYVYLLYDANDLTKPIAVTSRSQEYASDMKIQSVGEHIIISVKQADNTYINYYL